MFHSHESKEHKSFLETFPQCYTFFKTTVKLSENVYSSKVFPKRRKLLCLSYLLFLATGSLTGCV